MGTTYSQKSARQPVKSWYLYIIKCCDGTLYTGITNDLGRRIEQHNAGKASKYTRFRVPVRLIYKEACRGKPGALRKELRIKGLSRKEKEEYIIRKSGVEPRRRKGREGKQDQSTLRHPVKPEKKRSRAKPQRRKGKLILNNLSF